MLKYIDISDNSRIFVVKIYDADPFGKKGDLLLAVPFNKNKDAEAHKKTLRPSTSNFKIEIERIDTENGFIKEKI